MSCFSALESQIYTFFWVPQEIILLRHRVFREYAKIAVGPDFIHTLPSFLILMATFIILWKNPPSSNWICQILGASTAYKSLQVATSWVTLNTVLWFWLILQRILYCSVWTYWNYETESQEISYQWWQQVWSSYYPTSLQPPVMSAGFISWIISMSVAIAMLGCAVSTARVNILVGTPSSDENDEEPKINANSKHLISAIRTSPSEILISHSVYCDNSNGD